MRGSEGKHPFAFPSPDPTRPRRLPAGSVKTLAALMVITALAGLIYDAYTYAALALGASPLTAAACSQGCWVRLPPGPTPAHCAHNPARRPQILVIALIVVECEAAPDQERR